MTKSPSSISRHALAFDAFNEPEWEVKRQNIREISASGSPSIRLESRNADWLLSRQVLQQIATRISLVGEAIGFSVLGRLIIVNRHQADLNGLSGGSPLRWSVASALFYFSGYGFPIRRMSPLEGSAPDVLLRCRSGASQPGSLSLSPSQP